MMLYPKVLDIKKTNIAINILILISVVVTITCLIVDFSIGLKFHWSFLVIAGITYSWIVTMYSIKKGVNIASHVMVQIICLSILMLVIDYIIGYKRWSANFGIPIVLAVGNTTLFVLTIVSHKKYFKYILYQMIILILSLIPLVLYIFKISDMLLPVILSSFITILTFVTTVFLCGKELKEEAIRIFHI